jgi:hypothetical protein
MAYGDVGHPTRGRLSVADMEVSTGKSGSRGATNGWYESRRASVLQLMMVLAGLCGVSILTAEVVDVDVEGGEPVGE